MMKKLLVILLVYLSVSAFAQTEENTIDTSQIKIVKHKPVVGPALFVVDGVVFKNELPKIDIKSIERIHLLKQSTAKAYYGEAGKYGVVLITSKNRKQSIKFVKLNRLLSKTKTLFIIDGEFLNGQPVDLKFTDVVLLNFLQSPEAIEEYGNRAKNGAVVIITNPDITRYYQRKFASYSNDYRAYIEEHFGDDNEIVYLLNDGSLLRPDTYRNKIRLNEISKADIKTVVFTKSHKKVSGKTPVIVSIELIEK
jgi:hypothetical protein